MSTIQIERDVEQSIAILYINHPPANALGQTTFEDLTAALNELEQDDQVKVLLITGQGKFFAAGADIKEFTAVEKAEQGTRIAQVGQDVFNRMEAFPKPIIAAIHGAALGGGLELAMACHLRFSTPEAKLGLPELNLGLIPGFAGTQRLPQLIGKSKALELLFTSDPITGDEAHRLGLVDRVYDQDSLLTETKHFAAKVAQKGAISLRYALDAVQVGEQDGQQSGSEKEAALFGDIFMTEDAQEGIQAFLEKRKPQFKDR
ncbi:enoyl-CoA hydratase [Caldalkalibacillus salinus]|uniref:enoyl-CoA hydratase n=1 Tax=Caldalkalibacillus salinus TaxID=2803787 RepID=UPI0019249659|nr:enoyl-CoA hydratase [Caldalkalibacillus salinus]